MMGLRMMDSERRPVPIVLDPAAAGSVAWRVTSDRRSRMTRSIGTPRADIVFPGTRMSVS